MDTNLEALVHRPVGRLLWEYSLPAVIGMLVTALYNVVDRIFIGQWCGPDAIAGLTVTFPLMNLATAVGTLVGVGSSSRVSIVLGAGQESTAEKYLGNALSLTILNGCIYLMFFFLFLEPLLRGFGASDVTYPIASEYMLVLMPGLLLTNVAFSLNNVMRASGYPKRAMATMLIGAVANCILDPIFIKVLDLGILGAALATDIAMAISAIFVLWHFCRKDVTVGFRRGIYGLNWDIFIGIISIGAAPAVVNASACAINAIMNIKLLGYGGDTAIAAAGIFTTFASLITTITIGICQGMQPIVGYNYGAGRLDRLSRTYWLAVGVATILTLGGSVVGLCFPSTVARAFTDSTELISVSDNALRHNMLAFSVVGFQIISTCLFQSLGKAAKSIFLGLIRQVIFLVPLLLWLPGQLGLNGVWLSFPISDLFATLVTAILIIIQFRNIREEIPKAVDI